MTKLPMLFASLLLAPVVALAALVDPQLQNFARGSAGNVASVIVLFQAPARPNFAPRSPVSLIRRTLADQVSTAWARLQGNAGGDIARGDIRLVELHGINMSAVLDVSPNGLRTLANAPGIDKIYLNGRVILDRPVAKLASARFAAALPYDISEMALDQMIKAYPTLNGQGVLVGHIDTGVDGRHPALAGKIATFYDASKGKVVEPFDAGEHGTHTAGTVLGSAKDGFPMGVAPGARLVAVAGLTGYSQMLKGMEYIMNPDGKAESNLTPRLVTNSWNCDGAPDVELFYRAISAWEAAGILPVFSAGNSGPRPGTITHPHEHPNAFAIAAAGPGGKIADFSSRGPGRFNNQPTQKPDVTAPGVNIVSAKPGGGYQTMSGTSMSTPHVAGLIALLVQAAPQLTNQQIRDVVSHSADYVDEAGNPQAAYQWNANFGFGRVNALKAVNLLKSLLTNQRQKWASLLSPVLDLRLGYAAKVQTLGPLDGAQDERNVFAGFRTDHSRWIEASEL